MGMERPLNPVVSVLLSGGLLLFIGIVFFAILGDIIS